MKCVIPLRIIIASLFFLVGCVPVPPTPLPTPTVVAGNVLPVEKILHGENGSICRRFETEYQVFFIRSEGEWQDIRSSLRGFEFLGADEAPLLDAIGQTNFQTHGLLFAWRTCKPSGGYSIAINRVVEVSDHQLAVYIELRDLPPGGGGSTLAETGPYEIVRIPWSEENADNPTVEVVDYHLWSETH